MKDIRDLFEVLDITAHALRLFFPKPRFERAVSGAGIQDEK
jgi:hypothetical protein